MKVLVVVCVCAAVPALGRPSSATSFSSSSTSAATSSSHITHSISSSVNGISNSKRHTGPRFLAPQRPQSVFRVMNVPQSPPNGFNNQLNEIPRATLAFFTPPPLRTKEERDRQYFATANALHVPPAHASRLLNDVPFFDTIDHGKLVTSLQKRRKNLKLPLHFLMSSRPYFPFFNNND